MFKYPSKNLFRIEARFFVFHIMRYYFGHCTALISVSPSIDFSHSFSPRSPAYCPVSRTSIERTYSTFTYFSRSILSKGLLHSGGRILRRYHKKGRSPPALHRAWSIFEGAPVYIGPSPLALHRARSIFEGIAAYIGRCPLALHCATVHKVLLQNAAPVHRLGCAVHEVLLRVLGAWGGKLLHIGLQNNVV